MRSTRCLLGSLLLLLVGQIGAAPVSAAVRAESEGAVRRVLTLLNVVGEEYREGVVDGRVVLPVEYQEAGVFLAEAEQRLSTVADFDAARFAAPFAALRTALDQKVPLDAFRSRLDELRSAVSDATGVADEVFPPSPPSASRGRQLFAENCAPCHGETADGRGKNAAQLTPPPANFSDPAFMRAETPFDFFHVISVGKGTSAMPAWGDVFSLQERWDLIGYLWTVRHGKAGLAEGQGVFLAHCAGCHGAAGDGRGPYSAGLITPAPKLDSAEALARKSDQDLFASIAGGVAGTSMPAFERSLDERELWSVVAFVRSLSLGGDDGTAALTASAGQSGRRAAGLLTLLGDEYRKAASAEPSARELEYAEIAVLLEQAERQAPAAEAETGLALADRVRAIRQSIERREPAAAVIQATSGLAHEVEGRLPQVAEAAPAATGDALSETRRLLDEAAAAYERRDSRAPYLVSDAYFQFEPLEKKLAISAPDITRHVEGTFLELRAAMAKSAAEPEIRALHERLNGDLDTARSALQPDSSPYALAVQSATVILREGFEIVLIVGALLAYVTKAGQPAMRRSIWTGAAVGTLASLATAYAFARLLRATGVTVDVLEGITMLIAAAVLFSVSYWLISKAEADKWQRYIQGKVSSALKRGSGLALASAAFLAVYREGVETVLFYDALAASNGSTGALVGGFAAGCVLLVLLYAAFQRLGKRVPIRQFFLATGGLLYYLAFVFAGKGVRELQEGSWIGMTPIAHFPTVDFLGVYPTVETLLVQGVLLACVVYALAVTLRSRARAGRTESLLVEVKELKQIACSIRQDLTEAAARGRIATEPSGQRLDLLISRVTELENQMSFHFRGNGRAKP
jgi:high-affinity iron transporter